MATRPVRIAVALALLVGAWLVAGWYFSDVQKIHRRLLRIQQQVAKSPAESDIASLAKARAISDLFADPFSLTANPEGYSTSDRTRLVSGIHQYRSRSSTLVMEVSGEEIYIDNEGGGANQFFTARFLTDLGDLRAADRYDVRMHWRRLDGDWLIDDVQVTAVRPVE